jgi:hypothetical protein
MSEKLTFVVLGVIGLLAVAGLVVAGYEVRQWKREGPHWRRRMIAAGLLLLAALGVMVLRRNSGNPMDRKHVVTCYVPLVMPSPHYALSQRLPLLRELADSGQLDPQAVQRILEPVERDLASLEKPDALQDLSPSERAEAERVRDEARKQVQLIRARLAMREDTLEDRPEWKTIADAWRTAGPLAETGQSTETQRQRAKSQLEAAKQAATDLAKAQRLTGGEAQLLAIEADRLVKEIYRNPPTDARVTCYEMMVLRPAQKSLENLTSRIPLLRGLAQERKLHPAALDKVLGAVEADIRTLGNPDELKKLPPGERVKAEAAREEAVRALADVKKLVAEPK